VKSTWLACLAAALLVVVSACGSKESGAPQPSPLVTVTSVAIVGAEGALEVGATRQFSAVVSFSDGSTQTATGTASWFSTDRGVADVTAAGLVTARGVGSAEITATFRSITATQNVVVTTPGGLSCGVERWPVKTASDAAAAAIELSTLETTSIRALNLIDQHCSGIPAARTYPEEFRVFEVIGRVLVAKSEDDRDYHLALVDPSDPTSTLISEVPDPACTGAVDSSLKGFLIQARTQFEAIRAGRPLSALSGEILRVQGVGFYDFNHNQTGRSQSCLELHPVLRIERVQ
jgi:hypothetical protein